MPPNPAPPSIWSLVAIVVSLIALFVAVLNYRRKSSINLRGAFSWGSSRDCDDSYVTSVVIENLKDRAATVYAIYLRIGHNYFIKVDSFDDGGQPLVLKPFETFRKNYGPIGEYQINMQRWVFSELFRDRRVRKQLVLSTGAGRYVVRRPPKHWRPVIDSFGNEFMAVVQTDRAEYKGQHVGGRVRYVVDFKHEDGTEQVIQLCRNDYEISVFRAFALTDASLETVDTLRNFLELQISAGKLKCQSFKVIDVRAWRDDRRLGPAAPAIKAEYVGFWRYHVGGRIMSRIRHRAFKRDVRLSATQPRPPSISGTSHTQQVEQVPRPKP